LHNKQQLLRRRSRSSSSSSSRMMRVCHSRELGLGLVAMAEAEEGEEEHEEQAEHKKNVNGRVALDRLDEQIRSLSTSDYNPSSSSSSAPTRSIYSISKLPPPGSHEEDEKVTWPEFSDGFFVYVGIGLLLLTVVNNIAFRVIFGPIDKPVQKVSSAPSVRYRLRSKNEITSLDAPPIVNAP